VAETGSWRSKDVLENADNIDASCVQANQELGTGSGLSEIEKLRRSMTQKYLSNTIDLVCSNAHILPRQNHDDP
jgi:hypothetical protein